MKNIWLVAAFLTLSFALPVHITPAHAGDKNTTTTIQPAPHATYTIKGVKKDTVVLMHLLLDTGQEVQDGTIQENDKGEYITFNNPLVAKVDPDLGNISFRDHKKYSVGFSLEDEEGNIKAVFMNIDKDKGTAKIDIRGLTRKDEASISINGDMKYTKELADWAGRMERELSSDSIKSGTARICTFITRMEDLRKFDLTEELKEKGLDNTTYGAVVQNNTIHICYNMGVEE